MYVHFKVRIIVTICKSSHICYFMFRFLPSSCRLHMLSLRTLMSLYQSSLTTDVLMPLLRTSRYKFDTGFVFKLPTYLRTLIMIIYRKIRVLLTYTHLGPLRCFRTTVHSSGKWRPSGIGPQCAGDGRGSV